MLTDLRVRGPALLAAGLLAATGLIPTAAEQDGLAEIRIVAALVGPDLTLQPVPRHPLRLASPDGSLVMDLVTSFEGVAVARVPPGEYRLASLRVLDYQGSTYAWQTVLQVPAGGLQVELSNDNALVEKVVPTPAPQARDEITVFETARRSVVTVYSESTRGTGFVADPRGLILTNHHLVHPSSFLAVKPDRSAKYPAELVAEDRANDLAVLRVHPQAVEDSPPLRLVTSSQGKPPVVVGEKVVALGSPLSLEGVMTSGIVSKVEPRYILSDVGINPGNSGGPLLNLQGEVVGVTTFGIYGGPGAGVSGSIPVQEARALLDRARAGLDAAPSPVEAPLPEAWSLPFPAEVLDAAEGRKVKPKEFQLSFGKLTVHVLTPVILAALASEPDSVWVVKKVRDQDDGKAPVDYGWMDRLEENRAVVRILALPESRSVGRTLFKAEFLRMRLLRGGKEVTPIHPGRARHPVRGWAGASIVEDELVFGMYEYPPEAFRPGLPLVLQVFRSDAPQDPLSRDIPPELQESVWKDFQPFFQALRESQQDASQP